MSQQRMAGGQEFKQGMQKASRPRGGSGNEPSLIGAGAWDRQVGRESAQKDNAAIQGSTGASNLADYINVSKSATQGNNDFSVAGTVHEGKNYFNFVRVKVRRSLNISIFGSL